MTTNQPADFRDRLLAAQPTTPALRDEYRRELDALLNHRLTSPQRLLSWLLAGVWAAMAAACVWSAVHHWGSAKASPDFFINLVAYCAVFVLLTAGSVRNALVGWHSWRAFFRVPGMFFLVSSVTLLLALLRGLRAPDDPSSTFSVLFVLFFFLVCSGWVLQARIDAALLTTREHLVRIESRLANLAERLDAPPPPR